MSVRPGGGSSVSASNSKTADLGTAYGQQVQTVTSTAAAVAYGNVASPTRVCVRNKSTTIAVSLSYVADGSSPFETIPAGDAYYGHPTAAVYVKTATSTAAIEITVNN